MNRRPHTVRLARVPLGRLLVAVLLAAGLAACSGSGAAPPAATTPPVTTPAPRPASTARLTVVAPRNGATVKAGVVRLRLALAGARIVSQTTTRVTPDTGHVHVLLDGRLVSMNYQLAATLPPVSPGAHVVRVEFVAADHLPFDPRVIRQIAFQAVR
jgi:hypothetical protein